jgi:small subunit ribosomal protein S16
MLSLRLQRIGKKHQPSYRLVVAEKRSKLNSPPVEDLGSYNPFSKKASFNKERVLYWLKVGAQPTVTVHNLLVREGILNAPKIKINIKSKDSVPEGGASAEASVDAGTKEKAEEVASAEAV